MAKGQRPSKAVNRERLVVGYVRVSTDEQAREGVSLEAQKRRVKAFATGTGREIGEIVTDDGQSAKSLRRPGMQRILRGLRSGEIGTVIVLKLDRLTRSVRDLADLLETFDEYDTALVSVSEHLDTSTASGRLMLNLLASVSQWEREAIGERTAFALAHLRSQGKVYGHVPFGYRRVGDKLAPVAKEQTALASIKAMQKSGASLREIARWLTDQKIRPRQNGKAWYAASVSRILNTQMTKAMDDEIGSSP